MKRPWVRGVSRVALSFVVLSLAACSSNDLAFDAVTQIGPGDALGSAETGHYVVTRTVVHCDSSCTKTVDGMTYELCSVGKTTTDPFSVVQSDGVVTMSVERDDIDGVVSGWEPDATLPVTMKGGLYRDGHFVVGGAKPAVPGPGGTARLEGDWQDRSFIARARVYRALQGTATKTWFQIACYSDEDVSATQVSQ